MNELPVGRTIAHAYGFLFGRILTVVSLSWVAAVLFAGLRFASFKIGPLVHPIADHAQTAALHLGAVLGGLLLLSAMAIPLTRAALGEHEGWSVAHFVVGAREIRLFLAVVRVYVIVIALIAVSVIGVVNAAKGADMAMAQWPALAGTGLPIAAIAHGVAVALGLIVTTYVGLRLSFLLYAVAAAEPHASLRQAWSLGAGNVVRMLVVTAVIFVPVYAAVFAAEYWLIGPPLLSACQALVHATPPDMDALMALFAPHAEVLSLGAAVLLTVLAALGAGASATAYRRLTGADAGEMHEATSMAQGHDDHGHDDHGHGGHDAHGHGGHDDHGHGGHDDDGHGGHDDHGHGGHDDHGHGGHDDHGHGAHGHHDDGGHGHDDHGHGGHDDHGHGHHAAPADHHGDMRMLEHA